LDDGIAGLIVDREVGFRHCKSGAKPPINQIDHERKGDEREGIIARLLKEEPSLTLSILRERAPIRDPRLMTSFLGGFHKAGLPE